MADKLTLLRFIIAGALGFGVGGILVYFLSLSCSCKTGGEFSKLLMPFIFGAAGSVSLGFATFDFKKFLKLTAAGIIGFIIGSVYSTSVASISVNLNLANNSFFQIVLLFFSFVITGIIAGAFYDLALKKKIVLSGLAGLIGCSSGAFIGPLVGYGVGLAGASFFTLRLSTYLVMGIFIGVWLGIGVYLNERDDNDS